MAIDLAKLVVALEAQTTKFQRDLDKARGQVTRLQTSARRADQQVNQFSAALRRASQSAAFMTGPLGGVASRINIVAAAASSGAVPILAMSAAVAGLTIVLGKSIGAAEKFQRLSLRTEAVIKATGNTAGLTAKNIRDFSEDLARETLASVEGVEKAAQKLLTFQNIAGDVFKQTLRLAQDLAATGFGSLETNAVQIARAMEGQLDSLSRMGIRFSDAQKKQFDALMKTNRAAEAQQIVLQELERRVGGTGAAEGAGLAGKFDLLSQNVQEFMRNIGNNGPLQATTTLIDILARSVKNLNDLFFASGQTQIDKLVSQRVRLQEALDNSSSFLRRAREIRIQPRIDDINRRISALQDQRKAEQMAETAADAARRAHQRAQQLAAGISGASGGRSPLAGMIANLEQQAATLGKTSIQVELYKLKLAGATPTQLEFARAVLEAKEAFDGQQDLLKQGAQLTDQLRTPSEKLSAEYVRLNTLLDSGAISWETYNRAVFAAQDVFDATSEVARKMASDVARLNAMLAATPSGQLEQQRNDMLFLAKAYEQGKLGIVGSAEAIAKFNEAAQTSLNMLPDQMQKTTSRMEELANQAARNMQDAFADFLFNPFEGGLKGMLNSFSNTLARMTAEAASHAIFESIGSSLGGAGGLGGFIASIFGGKFASGGIMPAGRVSLVGEQGPELVLPSTSRRILSNRESKQAFASETPINVTVNVSGVQDEGTLRRSSSQIAAAAARAVGRGRRNL